VSAAKKQFKDAYQYYNRVLALTERKFGEDAVQSMVARLKLIDAAIGLKDWQEAENNLKKAESIALSKGDAHSQLYLKICQKYAMVLMGLNRADEAENYARKASDPKP
jgi:tetratricopeptide (TPR) repeat protein